MLIDAALQAALEHQQAGRFADAESIYREILTREPDHFDALHLLGLLAVQAGQPKTACALLSRAVALKPDADFAYHNLGSALRAAGRREEAVAACRKAVQINPGNASAQSNLGKSLAAIGRWDEGIATCREALRLRPDFAEASNNLGVCLNGRGQFDEAAAACRWAIQSAPGNGEAHITLGIALRGNGQLNEAATVFRQAIELAPENVRARHNLAYTFRAMGQIDESIEACRETLRFEPDYVYAHVTLANCYKDQGRIEDALQSFREAIALSPAAADLQSNLVCTVYFHPDYDAARILAENLQWDRRHALPLKPSIRPHKNDRELSRRLRIGYVSPDFCRHVVGQNLLPFYREHDRAQFEIYCYANVRRPDEVTEQFRALSDHWRDIAAVGDEAVAETIRADRIDILVDLALHLAHNRLPVFARKPAPIQVTYLGYCGTTGLEAIDYRLSDPYLDPPDTDLTCYRERTIRLPRSYWCYQPGGPTPEVSPLPAVVAGSIRFGCLNNFAKVSPAALDLWAEILQATPHSRLLLHAPAGSCREEISRRFEHRGVSPDCLEFVGAQLWDQYIRCVERIDIALDPFPYGGGITTCDALWMGAPVVTLSGKTAVGRGGRSILSNIGLPELIAESPEQYVQIAVSLAGDLPRLSALRSSLRDRIESSPLRDAKGCARDIEAAYRQMWLDWAPR